MLVKKAGGKVYGAEFTAAEKKAMELEIKRELIELDQKNHLEIDALFLWWLHEKLGFGPKRLKEFYMDFEQAFKDLLGRYEMTDTDGAWLCTYKLKEIGVDLEAWMKEMEG